MQTSRYFRPTALAVTAALAFPLTATAQDGSKKSWKQDKNIVEVAASAGSFKTLITAAKAAGLVDTLTGKGPLTVFAPTDAAFAKLPEGTIDALLADKAKLAAILTYHVVPGRIMSGDLSGSTWAATAQGQSLRVVASKGGVTVDGANVIKADIAASNGVIHVIDSVVLPRKNIVETAAAAGKFGTLLKAAVAAGLADTLANKGPFTVFAPTDEAFAAIPEATLNSLLEDKKALASILLYHVVPGRLAATDVLGQTWLDSASGPALYVNARSGKPYIDDSKIVATDVFAGNGIVHVVDKVIMPRKNIVETAIAAGSFKTLVTAVKAAGLADALQGKGPFTVFAPTDAAFAKLPEGKVASLLKQTDVLKSILTYHVVPGRVLATDIPVIEEGATASVMPVTLQGQKLMIKRTADGVWINGAKVVMKDIITSNGVIHVIDNVVLPTADGND